MMLLMSSVKLCIRHAVHNCSLIISPTYTSTLLTGHSRRERQPLLSGIDQKIVARAKIPLT